MEITPTDEQNFARRTHKIDICHASRLVAAEAKGALFIAAVSGKATLRVKIRAANRTLTAHSNAVETGSCSRLAKEPQRLQCVFELEPAADLVARQARPVRQLQPLVSPLSSSRSLREAAQ